MLGRLAKACNLCGGPRHFARYLSHKGIQRMLPLCQRCDNYSPTARTQLPPEGTE